jgi:hypothetical protein
MNCRTFQKNLEDYLENGMDFAGRFGIERHARQCIHCGKELDNAQHLSRMARSLDRVKAPPNFESAVLNAIGERKLRSRFSMFRRFLVFGFDTPSWRTWSLAASGVLAVGLGFFYWQNLETPGQLQSSARTAVEPVNRIDMETPDISPVSSSANPAIPFDDPVLNTDGRFSRVPMARMFVDYQTSESDYRDYRAVGPDNLPVIIPLPDTIHMKVSSPPEEYYLRNVSH